MLRLIAFIGLKRILKGRKISMIAFNHLFLNADVKQISENLNTNERLKVILSDRSMKLLKATRFSRQDIDHALAQAFAKQKSSKD